MPSRLEGELRLAEGRASGQVGRRIICIVLRTSSKAAAMRAPQFHRKPLRPQLQIHS